MIKQNSTITKTSTYTRVYETAKRHSVILNPNKPGLHVGIESDKARWPQLLKLFDGDDNGEVMDRYGQKAPAYITKAKNELLAVEKKFTKYQHNAVKMGRPKPTTWPADLLEEKIKAQARLDVLKEERAVIENYVNEMEAKKKKERNMLEYGPIGTTTLNNGAISEIDGQHVKTDAKGVPRINDDESPYNGMRTSVYYDKIVHPWNNGRVSMKKIKKENLPEIDPKWLE